jgi:hypothetical protein
MERDSRVAELRRVHAEAMRQRSEALIQLSAELFNQPSRHDAARSSDHYRSWQACSSRLADIEAELAALDADVPSPGPA